MPASFDRGRLATVQFVPPTPMTGDTERLRPELLEQLLGRMIGAGARVLLPAAGTGEFHSLSADEVLECVRVACQVADADCTVIAPVGLSLQHAIRIGRASAELGAAGLLVMPPVHPYVSDDGFAAYLRAIADAVPLPLLTYKRSAAPSDKLLLRLGEEGILAGVKYAVNDVDAVTRFVRATEGQLAVYCGTAERYAPFFMLAGAEGYTSGAGCVCPRLTLALHAALARHDYTTAMDLLHVLRPIEDFRARNADALNITLIKYAVELTGIPVGPPRPPQPSLSTQDQAAFEQLLEPILRREAALASPAPV